MGTSIPYRTGAYNWAHREELQMETNRCLEFHDLTEPVRKIVTDSGIQSGMVTVQSMHTTASILVNENEPLLLNDMKRTLERIASRRRRYQHDNFAIRTVNMNDNEPKNGHAHCKSLFLPTSVTLNVWDGTIQMGRWQRVFLLELDRPRKRSISVLVIGV